MRYWWYGCPECGKTEKVPEGACYTIDRICKCGWPDHLMGMSYLGFGENIVQLIESKEEE